MRLIALLICALWFLPSRAFASEPKLTITFGDASRNYTASELLARSDAASVTVPTDFAYDHPFTVRAAPLLPLLASLPRDGFDTLEAHATDGFVAQLPLALVLRGASGGASAWIAAEPPGSLWPNFAGQKTGPGPFFLVWEHPERSGVAREQWPYALAALTATESPAHRWPQLQVKADLPADAPARHGQAVFIAQCLPCHRMDSGGAADIGPDLGRPMGPTQYMTLAGLRALIRNPKSVRTWPLQRMQGFPATVLSDTDLDALIAYLQAMSPR